jgi:hypothetical protein
MEGMNFIQRKRRATYTIATWNVRSMYEGKVNTVQEEMNHMNIDILGISEMKWIGKGHFRGVNYEVMYSGHETHKKRRGNDHNRSSRKVAYRLLGSER